MMRRVLVSTATVVIFVVFCVAGLWLFAPWDAMGRAALDKARLAASSQGMFISYSSFEHTGVIFPTYTIKSLDIDQGMTKFTFEEVRLRVLPLSSVLAGGISCGMTLQEGTGVVMTPANTLKIDLADFKLAVSRSNITLANVRIEGDIKATGKLVVSRPNRTIARSTMTLRVSDNIGAILKGPMGGRIGEYAELTPDGEWRIKQHAAAGS